LEKKVTGKLNDWLEKNKNLIVSESSESGNEDVLDASSSDEMEDRDSDSSETSSQGSDSS